MPPGISTFDNKPIIITFLAMEKVILLCTNKTRQGRFGSMPDEIFLHENLVFNDVIWQMDENQAGLIYM